MWLAGAVFLLLTASGPLPEFERLEGALRDGVVGGSSALEAPVAMAGAAHLWTAGRFGDAARLLRRAEPDEVLGPFVRFELAQALFYDHDPAAAAAVFESLASGRARVVASEARRRWAEAELSAGHAAEAVALFRACLAGGRGPTSVALLEELGRALLASGERPAAAAALRDAWLENPDDPAAREARDELTALAGDGAAQPAASPAKVLRRAKQLLKAGHPEAAHSDLAQVEAAFAPTSRDARAAQLFLAQADRALGNDDEALAHWRRAAESKDGVVSAAAKIALARAGEARGRWAEAVALLDEVAVARRGRGDGAEAAYLSAWFRLEHGQTEQALAAFARLAGRAGRRHADEAAWWRGWTLYTQGRFQQAAGELAALAARSGGAFGAQALYWEARAWQEVGRRAHAEELLSRVREANPGSFYAVLAGGESVALPSTPAARCESQASGRDSAGAADAPFLLELRRALDLWALGYRRFVGPELDEAARLAHGPRQLWAVAQVEAALDEPGRAFALLASGRAACGEAVARSLALFPRPFRGEVERAARAVGSNPLLVWSVMRQESRFRVEARSAAQAVGAMQLLGTTFGRIGAVTGARERGRSAGLDAAAWYLQALSVRFGGNPALVAAAYNAGPEPVASWLRANGARPLDEFVERIPYRETRRYVKSVIANYAGYRALFGPSGPVIRAEVPPGAAPQDGVAF